MWQLYGKHSLAMARQICCLIHLIGCGYLSVTLKERISSVCPSIMWTFWNMATSCWNGLWISLIDNAKTYSHFLYDVLNNCYYLCITVQLVTLCDQSYYWGNRMDYIWTKCMHIKEFMWRPCLPMSLFNQPRFSMLVVMWYRYIIRDALHTYVFVYIYVWLCVHVNI